VHVAGSPRGVVRREALELVHVLRRREDRATECVRKGALPHAHEPVGGHRGELRPRRGLDGEGDLAERSQLEGGWVLRLHLSLERHLAPGVRLAQVQRGRARGQPSHPAQPELLCQRDALEEKAWPRADSHAAGHGEGELRRGDDPRRELVQGGEVRNLECAAQMKRNAAPKADGERAERLEAADGRSSAGGVCDGEVHPLDGARHREEPEPQLARRLDRNGQIAPRDGHVQGAC